MTQLKTGGGNNASQLCGVLCYAPFQTRKEITFRHIYG